MKKVLIILLSFSSLLADKDDLKNALNVRALDYYRLVLHAYQTGENKLPQTIITALENNGRKGIQNACGNNLAHLAIIFGDINTLWFLLQFNKINLEEKNMNGFTPLELAKALKADPTLQTLWDNGQKIVDADDSLYSILQQIPSHEAYQSAESIILTCLRESKKTVEPLRKSAHALPRVAAQPKDLSRWYVVDPSDYA